MCGINLIATTRPQDLQAPMATMQAAVRQRGPDAAATWQGRAANLQILLGAARLRITDPSPRADQPMVSACGRYVLAFNGQVYNHQDLRNELLQSGRQFRTASDTETVLYWLQEKGIKGLSTLKGMYALVFIDLQENKIILARDRHGIKPLFYSLTSERLLVSSRLPAILHSGLGKYSLRQQAVDEYLAYRHVWGSHTLVKEVEQVPPGRALVFDHTLQQQEVSIARPDSPAGPLQESLISALALVFAGPHKPALMLSGGVDSTLMLAMLNRELGYREVEAFTLAGSPDEPWAARAARQYGAHYHPLQAGAESLQLADEFVTGLDQPVGDHGALATWLLARQIAVTGKTVLSGAGADELFGGYNRHRAFAFYLRYQKLLSAARQLPLPFFLLPARYRQIWSALDSDPARTWHHFLQHYAVRQRAQPPFTWPAGSDYLQEALSLDYHHYLVNDVLAITDNATMQHSLEARVPYLYDDVVAAAGRLPATEKVGRETKAPLKALLRQYDGKAFAQRPKTGFGLPLAGWLRQADSRWLQEEMLNDKRTAEFLPRPDLLQMWRQHRQGKKDYSMSLWTILVLQKWLQQNRL